MIPPFSGRNHQPGGGSTRRSDQAESIALILKIPDRALKVKVGFTLGREETKPLPFWEIFS
jgi:hypothetical protein